MNTAYNTKSKILVLLQVIFFGIFFWGFYIGGMTINFYQAIAPLPLFILGIIGYRNRISPEGDRRILLNIISISSIIFGLLGIVFDLIWVDAIFGELLLAI